MNPYFSVQDKATSLEKFIAEMKEGISFCERLLRIKSAIKKLKGEDISVIESLIATTKTAFLDFVEVCEAFKNDSNSDENFLNYLTIFEEKENNIVHLVVNLLNETNFFSSPLLFPDILKDLEIATTKFIKIAK